MVVESEGDEVAEGREHEEARDHLDGDVVLLRGGLGLPKGLHHPEREVVDIDEERRVDEQIRQHTYIPFALCFDCLELDPTEFDFLLLCEGGVGGDL